MSFSNDQVICREKGRMITCRKASRQGVVICFSPAKIWYNWAARLAALGSQLLTKRWDSEGRSADFVGIARTCVFYISDIYISFFFARAKGTKRWFFADTNLFVHLARAPVPPARSFSLHNPSLTTSSSLHDVLFSQAQKRSSTGRSWTSSSGTVAHSSTKV